MKFIVVVCVLMLSACGNTTKLKDPSVFHLNKRNIIEKDLTSETVSSPLIDSTVESNPANMR